MTEPELQRALRSLTCMSRETEWVEFKVDNFNPGDIGEYLSALSNAAALHEKDAAYIFWGVEDKTHKVVGTKFKPRAEKVGNEELENWLTKKLTPQIDFRIYEFQYNGKSVVGIKVPPAPNTPVRFEDTEFIRIGSYKKKLREHPEKERALWQMFSRVPFEKGVAKANATPDEVLSLLDYAKFLDMTKQSHPESRAAILDRLIREKLITSRADDLYDITNLGAMLFAKNLAEFERLSRKGLRIVFYKDKDRVQTVREHQGMRGYAIGFTGALKYINEHLPHNEQIGQALRVEVRVYPELAIRELVANALIHQDFYLVGTGPMVEVFSDRMEITNPGTPLINTLRFMDEPPQSRNEALAAFLRRMNICEERGSGIDKVVFECEFAQLPAPDFQVTDNHTKAVLFTHKKLKDMDKADRIRACYQHACLCQVSNKQMTNESLRERFKISDENYPQASRIIKETLNGKLIKPYDPSNESKRHSRYVPFWA